MSKVVLITGANRGIGLEFVHHYLKADYKVFACCRSPEGASELLSAKQAHSDQLEIMPLDVKSEPMMEALSHTLNGQPIDILIHNAGVSGPSASFGQVTEEGWLDTLKTNTLSPLLLTQLLVESVVSSTEKKIVLITSKMGSIADNGRGGSYMYRSSKAALNAVGKSLSRDLSSRGVKIGILHPGWVKTEMGGSNALISTKESVSGMCRVIDGLDQSNSGQFFAYDGSEIPW
ncbi:SDR family oxidoreductase [Candidatus Sororendozoicomonas aggregata]|uniref:SDR family oxidoreductase n=1 Tax=Candidatus Sororendozoicomonas aggregata TaxID=3073239 RepID=UPI002ED514E1